MCKQVLPTIVETFSKRQNRIDGEVADVFQYETVPSPLRVQVVYIWGDAYGVTSPTYSAINDVFTRIYRVLLREYGAFDLGEQGDSPFEIVGHFFLKTEDTAKVLDIIEFSFQAIDNYVRENPGQFLKREISPDDAIAELNARFREHGVGYQYESGQLIRVDSEFVHSEVMKPALKILSDPMYKGANAEFLTAHQHYREGRYKACITECLKSFESCLKVICKARDWDYPNRATAKHLIEIVLNGGLIPTFMASHFTGLRSTLESGVPALRNNLSAHGQGDEITGVPEYIASYTLHLTALTIRLLGTANNALTPV